MLRNLGYHKISLIIGFLLFLGCINKNRDKINSKVKTLYIISRL